MANYLYRKSVISIEELFAEAKIRFKQMIIFFFSFSIIQRNFFERRIPLNNLVSVETPDQ